MKLVWYVSKSSFSATIKEIVKFSYTLQNAILRANPPYWLQFLRRDTLSLALCCSSTFNILKIPVSYCYFRLIFSH
jgi:hypothetical protein